MSLLSSILNDTGDGRLQFHCPACNEAHAVRISGARYGLWFWNQNPEAPTFEPGVRVRKDIPAAGPNPDPNDATSYVCMSRVVNGRISYEADCTHGMAGTTVDVPAWPL